MVDCDYCEREFAVCVSTAFLVTMGDRKILDEKTTSGIWMLLKLGWKWEKEFRIREVRRIGISADISQDLHIIYVHINVRSNYKGI
jgi:hypothetical protein